LPAKQRPSLQSLVKAIQDGTAQRLYGTLLSHPIFLDLIIDDVVNDKIQQRTRSSLVRSWIYRKIRRDQQKYQGEALRGDITQEARLIFQALEDVAFKMSERGTYVPIERLRHTDVVEILRQHNLSEQEIFEL